MIDKSSIKSRDTAPNKNEQSSEDQFKLAISPRLPNTKSSNQHELTIGFDMLEAIGQQKNRSENGEREEAEDQNPRVSAQCPHQIQPPHNRVNQRSSASENTKTINK